MPSRRIKSSYLIIGYLILCLLLGGSSMVGAIANGVLQLCGVFLLLGLFWTGRLKVGEGGALSWLLGLLIVFLAFTFVPLPVAVWTSLPLREDIVRGLSLMDIGLRPLPLTLSPQSSLNSLTWLVPPIAVFFGVLALEPQERRLLPRVILIAALASSVLGSLQVLAGRNFWIYLYGSTTENRPVGFFTNSNHEGTLLLLAILCIGYVAARGVADARLRARTGGAISLLLASGILLVVSVALSGSVAVYGLSIPAAAGALLIYRRIVSRELPVALKWVMGGLPILFVLASFAQIISRWDFLTHMEGKVVSRHEMAETTALAIAKSFPVGTGLGTFPDVYRAFQHPDVVLGAWVNHAHNDYLELILELGAVGLLLIVAFLGWWLIYSFRAWRSHREGASLARLGSLMVGIVLLHSLVDYPIRTAAIAGIFAAACALLASSGRFTAPSTHSRAADFKAPGK